MKQRAQDFHILIVDRTIHKDHPEDRIGRTWLDAMQIGSGLLTAPMLYPYSRPIVSSSLDSLRAPLHSSPVTADVIARVQTHNRNQYFPYRDTPEKLYLPRVFYSIYVKRKAWKTFFFFSLNETTNHWKKNQMCWKFIMDFQ